MLDAQRIPRTVLVFALSIFAAGVLGWLYETLIELWFTHAFVFRQMFLMPWSPIYAIGMALILLIVKRPFTRESEHALSWPAAFVSAAVIATLTELAGSYLIELSGSAIPWDYSQYFLNFQGRIALLPAVVFGSFGALILKIIYPWLQEQITKAPRLWLLITGVIAVLCGVDAINEFLGINTLVRNSLTSQFPFVGVSGELAW